MRTKKQWYKKKKGTTKLAHSLSAACGALNSAMFASFSSFVLHGFLVQTSQAEDEQLVRPRRRNGCQSHGRPSETHIAKVGADPWGRSGLDDETSHGVEKSANLKPLESEASSRRKLGTRPLGISERKTPPRRVVVPFADFLADDVGNGAAFCGHPSDSSSLRSPDGRRRRSKSGESTYGRRYVRTHTQARHNSPSVSVDVARYCWPANSHGGKTPLLQKKKDANVGSLPHFAPRREFLDHADLITSASVTGQSSAVCFKKHSHGGRGTPWMAEGGALGVTAAATVGKVPAGVFGKTARLTRSVVAIW